MTELYEMLNKAEEAEAQARYLEENASEQEPSCGFEPGSAGCREHGRSDECISIRHLFRKAWLMYRKVEAGARKQLANTDSEESVALLARVLLDIHIHPNSLYQPDTPALWESQYLWLKLYYRTKKEEFMEKARLCDGIRHASIVEIKEPPDMV